MNIAIRGVREPRGDDDGYRVLADRLWPRGLSKEHADWDRWAKEVAPSAELRTWWRHDEARRAEFAARYRAELDGNPVLDELRAAAIERGALTLLTATHDPAASHLPVLRDVLAAEGVQHWP